MHGAILLIAVAAAPASKDTNWNFDTGPRPSVEVSNSSGSISIQGTTENKVSIQAVFPKGDADRGKWTVEAEAKGDKVQARVCCGPCSSHSSCSSSVEVKLSLRVPQGSGLDVSSVDAVTSISGVAGKQEISIVSGNVASSGSAGELHVSTVSGDVKLEPQTLARTDISSVSGDVTLQLPANPDAKVDFSTVSGDLNGKGVGLGSTHKTWGRGTVPVEVSSVSGDLRVTGPGGADGT